ncbi:glutamate--tRNA ligase [Oceanicella sp. SM1341]|uniref:glutamate--tRNA ligase n=1 Tax=Oceanicella sp. SM1341 TaxID=1548889 RepID=UPI000E5487ED|nr:glutamate--tRNA ligase [Oceanicella sp. SM1341]
MITTRFAPSPTGYLHVGNLRAALFSWALARKAGGRFILRLDDTDTERSRPEYADQIRRDLEWLGLTWDREERQSERLELYRAAAERLSAEGRLYECFETPVELDIRRRKQLNMGRPPVYDRAALALTGAERDALRAERGPGHWRFLLDLTRIGWEDGILGAQSIDAGSVSDPVLIRGDGLMLYTLASVVDDADMGVSDIVRGADHITNTATQLQIFEALGAPRPRFAHHSLLTGPGGAGLSKREGALALKDLAAAGVEPLALLSLIARLGSADPVEPRTSLAELVEGFDLSRFGAAPTGFDADDLGPLTAKVLHALPWEAVAERAAALGVPEAEGRALWEAVRGNLERFDELAGWWQLCREGAAPVVAEEDAEFAAEALALLPPRPWTAESWPAWTAAAKAASGRKGRALFLPLRRLLTGRDRGPEMDRLMPLLTHVPDLSRKELPR